MLYDWITQVKVYLPYGIRTRRETQGASNGLRLLFERWAVGQFTVTPAVSMGQCNTCLQFICRSLKS
jgi:hypothetical protein